MSNLMFNPSTILAECFPLWILLAIDESGKAIDAATARKKVEKFYNEHPLLRRIKLEEAKNIQIRPSALYPIINTLIEQELIKESKVKAKDQRSINLEVETDAHDEIKSQLKEFTQLLELVLEVTKSLGEKNDF